jgi:hypothetical protein
MEMSAAGSALSKYPQSFHNQITSPVTMLRKRYKINE